MTINTPASAEPPDPAGPAGGDASRSVTLVTGDRVTVTDHGGVVIDPGAGRDAIAFVSHRTGQSTYVIPSDAVPLLAAGRLDHKLFDVALLREAGYHDQRADLPLIVTREAATAAGVLTGAGAEVTRTLPAVDGLAARVDKAGAAAFWSDLTEPAGESTTMADELSTVWLDAPVELFLDQSVPQVGAPAAWEVGLDGAGVSVAVLDTGVDEEHPDLAERVVAQANFTEGDEDHRDLVGHGTHVASTVAGTGAASGGQYRGVAPGADLLDGKVCTMSDCATSWVLAGMQWAAEQGARVVNMSLGWDDNPPLEEAVGALTDEYGVLFVASAGNAGADASVGVPAAADAALAVGAVDREDALTDFSSRGPRRDGALKPDITAPGAGIVAARSQHGAAGVPGEPYVAASGTSMSSPHVAGAAAILAQQHPDWSPAQLKAGLMAAAAPNPALGVTEQGAGRLDVARAVSQAVTTAPASVSFARQEWPHDDDAPEDRVVRYDNHGEADLTLAMAVDAAAPDGMFTVDPPTVTVPAGGSAEVVLSSDTRVADADGYFGGYLTATGSGVAVTTPFGVDREVESYDVTLSHLDRSGEPSAAHYTLLQRLDQDWYVVSQDAPEPELRLPAGEYLLGSQLIEPRDGGGQDVTMLVQPKLVVTGDMTVTLDARAAEPVSLAVPDRAAVPVVTLADTVFTEDEQFIAFTTAALHPDRLFTAQVGPPDPLPGLATMISGTRAVPARDTVYQLAYFEDERFVTGFERTATRPELARVRRDYAVQVDGSEGTQVAVPLRPEPFAGGIAVGLPIALPHTRTEYYQTGGRVEWLSVLEENFGGGQQSPLIVVLEELATYRAGHSYRERWNYAVFGPVLTNAFSGVRRAGDELTVVADLYGDGAGHWAFVPSAATMRVFRDGELVAQAPDTAVSLEVPPAPAAYRVEVEAARPGAAPLSRQTSLAWEFESGKPGAAEVVLPVPVVRFAPRLDAGNTAPAGRPLVVPVSVQTAPGSAAGEVADLAVEVSFDDGASWRPLRVAGDRFVVVPHPPEAGFVSLRATATDASGNAVEQTVIRAYEIR